MPHALDPLLRPRSVAIVGASDKPNSNGQAMFEMSRIDGYDGPVYPVNPRLKTLAGQACYAGLVDLPEVPEHVVIGVASRFVEAVLDQAIDLGVKSATIFAACYLDDDTHPPLARRVASKARAAGMTLCGANCMGFYTPSAGLRVASAASPAGIRQGGIAWIAQSGSAFAAPSHSDRRLGFSLCVSTGMELVTTVSDYMDWALHQPETRVIGLFIESIRDPAGFLKALEAARQKAIPVVVLKVGRTLKSAQMAVSHTGAIAGNDAVYQAVFRAYGVHRVADMDEMAATLALFDTPRRVAPGLLGTVHDSGGERELVVDLAEDIGLGFAELEPATCAKVAKHLESGLVPENPLDAYGTHNDLVNRFAAMTASLVNDPNVAMGLFMANPRDGYAYAQSYTDAVLKAAEMTKKPLALVSNYSMSDERNLALLLKEAGVPLLRGTRNALLGVRHVMADRDYRDQPAPAPVAMPPADLCAKWRARLGNMPNKKSGQKSGDTAHLSEAEGLEMLDDFDVSVPRRASVTTADNLEGALSGLRFPLALKTAEDHAHKSDVGGVKLNIADMAEAHAAYGEMAGRLGPRALFMEMVPPGVELALGAVCDDGFGPVVVVSAGGVLVEFLGDSIAALAPFDQATALRLLRALQIAKLLAGYRGQPAVDMAVLAQQVARFSQMVAGLGTDFTEIDVNPLICSATGAVAADCLIVGSADHPE